MNRIQNLTGVRAYAALWVVALHTQMQGIGKSGWMGVDIFFVLSGLVLSLVYVKKLPPSFDWLWYCNFLYRRIAKIYPLHIITFCAVAAMLLVGRHFHYQSVSKPEYTLWSAICNILMLHSLGLTHLPSWNTLSWSVSAEWFAYSVLFAPMVFMLRRVSIVYVALLASALWISVLLLAAFVLKTPMGGLTTNGVLRIIPEFTAGYLLFRVLHARTFLQGDLGAGAGILLVMAAASYPERCIWLLLPGTLILLGGLYSGGPLSDKIFGNRVVVLLGDASYSIYLMQTFILVLTHLIIRRIHLPESTPIALLEIGCVALAGLLTFRYVEEPLRQALLKRFSEKASSRKATSITSPPALV